MNCIFPTIRPITESDVPNIRAVALEAWHYTYRNVFDGQFIEHFVNQNYAPERLLSLFPLLQTGVMNFNVLEHGEQFLQEHGINTYFCFVHKDNELGKHFYIRSAFQHIAEKSHED